MTLVTDEDVSPPYAYVMSEEVVRDVVRLLMLGCELAVSASVTRDEPGGSRGRTLLELEGLGKEIWQGVDPKTYLQELRDEWEPR